ncbi:amine sulfotransferase-like [Anneissia japonica]|uniref:amine sulfotransferase-like n=1 Tax=Anneissia japonica TaxID=1529436 RepID=UPI0014257CA7|nr:amine sulfotransferase-like [Anneissia japonica]
MLTRWAFFFEKNVCFIVLYQTQALCRRTVLRVGYNRIEQSPLDTWHYEGIELPILVNEQTLLSELKNFKVRHDDIWLCTYPKAGMHWTWQILSLLKFDGDFNKLSLSAQTNSPPSSPFEISMKLQDATAYHAYEYFEKLPSPRIITTHLPMNLLPTQVFEKKVKVCI